MNTLYFGDNLPILRHHLADASIDLVYLDPPFNSNRAYNVYLNTPRGQQSDAQITAFDDTWHWGEQAEREYAEILQQPNTNLTNIITALRSALGENDLMAYLVMMSARLLELHRALKPTGSLYLHCDPTASHYLKIVLDAVFGPENFRNEIIWKRQSAHSDAKHKFADIADIILFYVKSKEARFSPQYGEYDQSYVDNFYRFDDNDGRGLYRLGDMASPNPRPNMMYEWQGFAYPAKGWRYQLETMQRLHDEGRIYYPRHADGSYDTTKRPSLKRYLNEQQGSIVTNIWDDINPLHSSDAERLGYPTQKPLSLLERIIQASSNPGDVVLDPFCGCGTAVHAAQKLGRQWVGIDITHLAIHLIERRLREAFPGIQFRTQGIPKDLDSARDLANRDKYEFQFWACSLVGAQPYQGGRRGADGGTDGLIYFQDDRTTKKIIVSVKGGENVTRTMIADLKNTVERENAAIGLFITLAEPTAPMRTEAISAGYYTNPYDEQFPKIQILTIAELLDGRQPQYRDLTRGGASFRRAQTERPTTDQPTLFGE